MNRNKILEANNAVKLYTRGSEKACAIDKVSFVLEEGDFLAIIGPSGSGKTTFLNLIGCIDRLSSGSIKLDGIEVQNLKDKELAKIRNKTIGFVFQ